MAKIKILVSLILILIITAAVFSSALKNDFTNWDDPGYVSANNTIRSLSWRNINKIFTSFIMDSYQPVAVLSYLLEYHFFKLNPVAYHLTNIILHLLNCLLVFWLIFILSQRISISFLTALFWGIHPLKVESVAWVSERKSLFYALFFLLALISYVYYLKKNKAARYYLFSLFCFTLSFFSKGMAVSLPFALFLIDYFLYRKPDKHYFLEKIPFFILAFIFSVLTITAHYSGEALREVGFNFYRHMLEAGYIVIFYLSKILFPFNLSIIYPYPDNINTGLHWLFLISPLLVVILIGLLIYFGRYSRKIIFGGGFFLALILPVLQFVPVGRSLVADRHTYLSCLGILYLVSEGFLWLYHRKNKYNKISKALVIIILILVIGGLCFLSYQRNLIWKNSVALWSGLLNRYPIAFAYNSRGAAYYTNGQLDKALSDFNRSIQINPDADAKPYLNRALVYERRAKFQEAVSDYTEVLRINPGYADAYLNRGTLYYYQGEFPKSVLDYTAALKLKPGSADIYYNRALAYVNQRDYAHAIRDLNSATEIKPDYTEAYGVLAVAYFFQKAYDLSRECVSRAQARGYQFDPRFLADLKNVSGPGK